MSLDEQTVLQIAALKKYNERYDNTLYVGIMNASFHGNDVRSEDMRVAAQDCALLICGDPTLSQYRWLDLFMFLLRESHATRLAVLTFLSKFKDEVI